jgi:hypothetical protein
VAASWDRTVSLGKISVVIAATTAPAARLDGASRLKVAAAQRRCFAHASPGAAHEQYLAAGVQNVARADPGGLEINQTEIKMGAAIVTRRLPNDFDNME